MKQTKRLAGLLLAVTVLCMFSALNCPAAEIGTQELIANGDFETLSETEQGGLIMYNSKQSEKKTWANILKTDGASGAGSNYILIEAVKSDNTCNSGLNYPIVQLEAGKDYVLSLLYTANFYGAMQVRYTYKNSVHNVNSTENSLYLPPTDGSWKKYSLLIPAYTFDVDGVDEPVYADGVSFCFYNIARLAEDSEGTKPAEGTAITVGFDNISLRTYSDDGLLQNGDFTLGGTSWGTTIKEGGTVEFADGVAKIKGTDGTFFGQTCIAAPASLLPNGFNHTYYKVSVKIKVEAPEGYEGTVPTNPGIKIFGSTSDGSEENLTSSNSWRGTVDIGNGWKQCTYFTQKIATNSESLTVYIRGVGADLTMYVDDVVLEPYNFRIHNGSNVNVNALTPGGKISIEAVVANSGSTSIAVRPFYAFYAEKDGNKQLISLAIPNAAVTVEAGKGSGISSMRFNNIVIPTPPEGYTVTMKAMIFEEGKFKPLCQSRIMTQAQ